MVTGLVLAWLYAHWFGYMVTELVIWLLIWLYGSWFGYMVTGLV